MRRSETLSYTLLQPVKQLVPLVFSSPHSGTHYPASFLEKTSLPHLRLRSTEDTFVHTLFGAAPINGAMQLAANFPRCYVDPNRAMDELDPTLFDAPLAYRSNAASLRVKSGLGVIPRVNLQGEEIYSALLPAAEAAHRLETFYKPYHTTLKRLIASTRRKFGFCLLIDCHSMPSVGGPIDEDNGQARVDFILGDFYGKSCSGLFSRSVAMYLRRQGYSVRFNMPYAGGYITQHYGVPHKQVHALQIEVCRSLYMNEQTMQKSPRFAQTQLVLSGLIQHLAESLAGQGADMAQAAE